MSLFIYLLVTPTHTDHLLHWLKPMLHPGDYGYMFMVRVSVGVWHTNNQSDLPAHLNATPQRSSLTSGCELTTAVMGSSLVSRMKHWVVKYNRESDKRLLPSPACVRYCRRHSLSQWTAARTRNDKRKSIFKISLFYGLRLDLTLFVLDVLCEAFLLPVFNGPWRNSDSGTFFTPKNF